MNQSTSKVPDEYKNHVSPGTDWQEIVAWVGDLPPLPHVASRAISMLEDPDVTAGELTNVLSSDTALAARVLKIANSAMFSRQRQITTLSQAIMIVGFKTLKGVVVAATLRQLNKRFDNIEKMIWANSLCTAIAAHRISQHLKKHYVEEAFLLGLLHDLGKIVLVNHSTGEYKNVIELTKQGTVFHAAEEEVLGFSHPLIGALVAKKWNFSAQTCQVILHHHDPIEPPIHGEQEEKTAIIVAADCIAHVLGHGHLEGYPDFTDATYAAMAKISIDQETAVLLVDDVSKLFGEQSSVFN